jgi:MFS transporter, DHA2 family, multidrug resistance protein
VALSLGTILPVVYALKETAKDGVTATNAVVLAVGVAVGVVFVRRQRGLAEPVLDLRLFRVRAFSAAVSIMLVGALTMGGVFLLVSQYLQLVAGLTPVQAGLWLVPQAGAVVVGSLIAPRLARRFRPEFVLGFGIAMGIAVFGSVGTAVYRDRIAVPAQVPADAAALATDSMAGALQAAAGLPGPLADGVLATARDAFASGLHTVAGIGAAGVVVFAVVGMVALRRTGPAVVAEPPAPVLEHR